MMANGDFYIRWRSAGGVEGAEKVRGTRPSDNSYKNPM